MRCMRYDYNKLPSSLLCPFILLNQITIKETILLSSSRWSVIQSFQFGRYSVAP